MFTADARIATGMDEHKRTEQAAKSRKMSVSK